MEGWTLPGIPVIRAHDAQKHRQERRHAFLLVALLGLRAGGEAAEGALGVGGGVCGEGCGGEEEREEEGEEGEGEVGGEESADGGEVLSKSREEGAWWGYG